MLIDYECCSVEEGFSRSSHTFKNPLATLTAGSAGKKNQKKEKRKTIWWINVASMLT
jgi:hypothetical protein